MKKYLIASTVVAVLGFIPAKNFGYRNLDDVKAHAVSTFEQSGFKIVGYEGYLWDLGLGAEVWYIVKRDDSPIIYDGFLVKWGTEYHIYHLKAMTPNAGVVN